MSKKIFAIMIVIVLLRVSAVPLPGVPAVKTAFATGSTPINVNATQKAKDTLAYLYNMRNNTDNRLLSGQYWDNTHYEYLSGPSDYIYDTNINALNTATGKWAGIIGAELINAYGDFGSWWSPAELSYNTYPRLYNYSKSGGIPLLYVPTHNPWTGGGLWDASIGTWSDLFDPSKSAYKHLHQQLDIFANGLLARLNNDDIPAIVILFSEITNGGNGHWYEQDGAASFIELYQHCVDYLKGKGLNNLLFAHETMDGFYSSWYPGDNYVDLIAWSIHSDSGLTNYATADSYDKTMGISQFLIQNYDMRNLLTRVENNYPNITFVNMWSGTESGGWAMLAQQYYTEFMQDSRTANRNNTGLGETFTPLSVPATIPADLSTANEPGSVSWNWNTDDNLEGWTSTSDFSGTFAFGRRLHAHQWNNSNPALMSPSITLSAANTILKVRMMNHSNSTTASITWQKSGDSTWYSKSWTISAVDADWKTYQIDLKDTTGWNGTITSINFYPIGTSFVFGSSEIDYIAVTSNSNTNVALNKDATSSDNYSSSIQLPGDAVDGIVSPASKWSSSDATGAKWLQVDLGSSHTINRWVVQHAGAAGEVAATNTKDFKLQYYNGSAWVDADSVTGNTANTTDETISSISAQLWRLYITNVNDGFDGYARIAEFELYN